MDRFMFAGKTRNVSGDSVVIGDLVRDQPGASAIFEVNLDAPEGVARESRMAVELLDDAIELRPGKAAAVVPGETFFGEDFHGTRMTAADEPDDGGEHGDRQRCPKNMVESEAVFQLQDRTEKQRNEDDREDRQTNKNRSVRPDD